MTNLAPFHLAIPVKEIVETRAFYREVIGCAEGRSSDHWVDFNFFGHQLVIHISEQANQSDSSNPVDGHDVPVPHFGVVLAMKDWEELAERLKQQNVQFVIEPYVRFKGKVGEQATMFFRDPSGNALEFKAFADQSQLFAK
ncbi:MAG: VOC family protein [Cyclobacteriaceae bacterium]